jgi:hypothetical protein
VSMVSRTRRPALFWEGLLAEWRASGLSPGRFARSRGVAANSFAYWVKRASPQGGLRLVPVDVLDRPVGMLEVSIRGAVVRMPVAMPAAWVAELLVRAEQG